MTITNQTTRPARSRRAKRVVGYVRVDSRFKADQVSSVRQQRQACRTIAAKHGATITAEYCDLGASGTTRDRDGLSALLAALDHDPVDAVVCADLDRLARGCHLLTELRNLLARRGVALLAGAQDQLDEPGEDLRRIARSAVRLWERGVRVTTGDLPILGNPRDEQRLVANCRRKR